MRASRAGRCPWIAVAAMSILGACGGPAVEPEPIEEAPEPDRVAFSETPELAEIAQLEYARDLGGGRLAELSESGSPEIRRRATVALGRFPYPDFGSEVTEPLARALEDEDPYVRRSAVFGLGLRGDPEAGSLLAAYRNDADPTLRARVAEASKGIDSPILREEVLQALRDRELEVRVAAVLAIGVWDPAGAEGAEADRRLLDVLLPPDGPGVEVDAELRWRILYALARRKSELGRGAYQVFHDSELALERLFATRGLAAIELTDDAQAHLIERAGDADWRVAVEALRGLGRDADAEARDAVLASCASGSAHVRRVAFESLAGFGSSEAVVQALIRGTRDVSPSVQAAALGSLAAVLPSAEASEQIGRFQLDEDPVARAGVAAAAAKLASPEAIPLLKALAKDANPRVAGTAIGGLGGHLDADTRRFLHAVLTHPDNGLRLAAVLALQEGPDAADVVPLGESMAGARGDIAPEVTFNALRGLGKIGGDEAEALVRRSLAHPDRFVRRVASEVLTESFGEPAAPVPPAEAPAVPSAPLPGRDFPRYTRNPEVEVVTTRGTMVFELFPAEAPVHVHNFLTLAEGDHYDGLIFHRVVPDFVIQGGDYRGDGNGGSPWNGRALPQEFTPRNYVRGSLGMPRNEDPDSGGSQIFVTHRPTPHLDHRYTIFGELRRGGDVLDRIEVGDRILDIVAR